ncbi:MAG: hypothetical protein MI799_00470, partial [Desulfobacterales bacterium]|nr:hypothetical protein [Desulfobacterales bacterium]
SFGGGLSVDTGGVDDAGYPVEIEISYDAKVRRVQATAYIALADFIYAGGTVNIQKESLTVSVSDGSGSSENVDVEVLRIGAENLAAFAGVNGPYINDDGSQNSAAMGISLGGVSLAMAWMKTASPDGTGSDLRTWTALKAEAGLASFVGVDGLEVELTDFILAYNAGSGTHGADLNDTVVDFSAMSGGGLDISTGSGQVTLDFSDERLQAGGNLRLGVLGFFYIEGDFFLQQASGTIEVTDGSSSETVEVNQLIIGGQAASAFAGLNGSAGHANALGLSLIDVQFGLALFKPVDITDTRTWTALKAVAASASFNGIEGLTLAMSDLIVAINQGGGDGNTTVVDFNAEPLAVTTDSADGDVMNLDFDGGSGALLQVSGAVQLDLFGFLMASGSFSFEKSSTSITVTDAVTPESVAVDQLVMGGQVVSAFAGINGGTADALGFVLSDISLGLALFAPRDGADLRSWTSVKALAGSAAFTGVTGLELTAANLDIAINQGHGTGNNTVVDFTSQTLAVNDEISLDFDGGLGALLIASGTMDIDLYGFFLVSGSLAVERTTRTLKVINSDDATSDVEVELLTIGGEDLSVFAGVNGGTANAVGLSLEGADFGLAMAVDVNDSGRSWVSLSATASTASVAGM